MLIENGYGVGAASGAGGAAFARQPGALPAPQAQAGAGAVQGTGPKAPVQAYEKAYARLMNDKFGAECQTCKNRRYQDGSDDMSVSFQTPQHIDPAVSASVVSAHEQEHVTNEQANARREGGEVVSQSVVLHGARCPECGRYYIAGGTTTTVTRSGGEDSREQQGGSGGHAHDTAGQGMNLSV